MTTAMVGPIASIKRWSDARAADRLVFLEGLRRAEIDEVLARESACVTGARVLEVGSGTGAQLNALSSRAAEVVGIDIDESNYASIRDSRIVVYDGRTIPFPDASFDVVFSSNVLEHIAHRDAFQQEIARVLKPSGHCLHVVPTHRWRLFNMAMSLLRFPLEATIRAAVTVRDRRWALPKNAGEMGALLLGPRHGEFGNFATEPAHMHPRRWRAMFEANGWTIVSAEPMRLAYSGASVFATRLSLARRRQLARWLGSSMMLYHLRRRGYG